VLTCFTDDSGAAKEENEAAANRTAAMPGNSFMINSRCFCLFRRISGVNYPPGSENGRNPM
jgi:hypothetical protein